MDGRSVHLLPYSLPSLVNVLANDAELSRRWHLRHRSGQTVALHNFGLSAAAWRCWLRTMQVQVVVVIVHHLRRRWRLLFNPWPPWLFVAASVAVITAL